MDNNGKIEKRDYDNTADIDSKLINNVDYSFNLCLDSKDKHYYAIWDGRELAVKQLHNLKGI